MTDQPTAPYRPNRAMQLILRLCRESRYGNLTIRLPSGEERRFEGAEDGPDVTWVVHRDRAARRFLTGGILGFCEAYLDGDWSSPDVGLLFEWALRNEAAITQVLEGKTWYRLLSYFFHLLKPNGRRGARKNIAAHYDLGNGFYERWLDKTMTYSSAKFAEADEPLETAQENKYRALIEKLDLRPEHRLLEIGCGWGGFAEYAAKHVGCDITAITISPAQYQFAKKRIAEAGLDDRVEIRLQDYRDVTDHYDRIASIEMFEAVGEQYWPVFFDTLRDRLTDGGRAALQIITIEEHRFPIYRRSGDYIQRYIFPGGMLPTVSALEQQVQRAALRWEDVTAFGRCYAATLKRWNEQFQKAWPDLTHMGFDERFKRMWEQYLHYCAAGFQVGTIDVVHLTISKTADDRR